METYENGFTQGLDRYPRTRTDAFNILANYKEDERNHFRAARSNNGVAFTTRTETNNHPDTHGEDVSHIEDLSTTSDLTTSTNPQQQQGSALVTTGGGRGCNRNGRGSAGQGRSIITCFRCGDTGHYASACPYSLEEAQRHLAAAQSARSDDDSGTVEHCRILGLTALNSLLQYVNWLVWEVCSVD